MILIDVRPCAKNLFVVDLMLMLELKISATEF